jgi:hypothetical protein
MDRRLAAQTLKGETDGVIDEALHVDRIELIERERLDACSRGG